MKLVPCSLAAALGLTLLTTACGGKATPATAPAGGGAAATGDTGDGAAATPFAPDSVRDALAAMAVTDSCSSADEAATLGALFQVQTGYLGSPDQLDIEFTCRPDAEPEHWECTWSVFTRPSGTPDPEDPCAEGGATGFQIIVRVDRTGAILADSIVCNAPG